MTLKRSREEVAAEAEVLAMANCLVLLSRPEGNNKKAQLGWDFECKTCKKKFNSFQALGGHRASHKRPKLEPNDSIVVNPKKKHECPICGMEFALGQALGGHMRKHRTAGDLSSANKEVLSGNSEILSSIAFKGDENKKKLVLVDLNLTPLENGLMAAAGGRVKVESPKLIDFFRC